MVIGAMIAALWGCQPSAPLPEDILLMDYTVQGMECYPSVHFILTLQNGVFLLTNASGCAPEEARTTVVSQEFIIQLRRIIEEEHIMAYKTDYRPFVSFADGDRWSLTIRFDHPEKSVISYGWIKQPPGNGLARLRQLCLEYSQE